MLKIGQAISRNCQGVTRRELLQVGGLGVLGYTLADCLRGEQAASANPRPVHRHTDTSCILIFLEGGPSQLETFDPKPNAPNDIRGPLWNYSHQCVGNPDRRIAADDGGAHGPLCGDSLPDRI